MPACATQPIRHQAYFARFEHDTCLRFIHSFEQKKTDNPAVNFNINKIAYEVVHVGLFGRATLAMANAFQTNHPLAKLGHATGNPLATFHMQWRTTF